MPYYVYILRSYVDGTFYKGVTTDYHKRLEEHNGALSTYTSTKIPWELFYVELQPDRRLALIREKKLKKCKREYFEWLQYQPSNILNGPSCHGLG
jgi:putative endonuclease